MYNGETNEVINHVNRSVVSAIKVKDSNSLAVFSNIRSKINNNQYKNIIKISDAIIGKISNQSPGLFNKCLPPLLDRTLPEKLENLIKDHQGMKKMFPFATRLINHLIALGGSANLGRKWFNDFTQSHHAKAAVRLCVLERAQIITVGKTYAPGKFGRRISVRREIINQYWPGLEYR